MDYTVQRTRVLGLCTSKVLSSFPPRNQANIMAVTFFSELRAVACNWKLRYAMDLLKLNFLLVSTLKNKLCRLFGNKVKYICVLYIYIYITICSNMNISFGFQATNQVAMDLHNYCFKQRSWLSRCRYDANYYFFVLKQQIYLARVLGKPCK